MTICKMEKSHEDFGQVPISDRLRVSESPQVSDRSQTSDRSQISDRLQVPNRAQVPPAWSDESEFQSVCSTAEIQGWVRSLSEKEIQWLERLRSGVSSERFGSPSGTRSMGQVVRKEGRFLAVRSKSGEVIACMRAVSCLVEPQIGDWVEVFWDYPDGFVVSVLSSLRQEVTLDVPCRLVLKAPEMKLDVEHEVHCHAESVRYEVKENMTIYTNQLSEHVKSTAYQAAETSVIQATQVGICAEKIVMS